MGTKYYEQQSTSDPFAALQPMKGQAQAMQKANSAGVLSGLKASNVVGTGKEPYNLLDVEMAIRNVYDDSERAQMKFIMLGEVAQAIKEKRSVDIIKLKAVEYGFPEKANTPEVKSLFKTWGYNATDYGYEYAFTPPTKWDVKVPCKITVYKEHYTFFDNPDRGFYGVDDFWIPNPFKDYWGWRNKIV